MSDVAAPRIGLPPESRRQQFVKLCWMGLWMLYLAYPISDLVSGPHRLGGRIAGWILLVLFLGCYGYLVLRRSVTGTGTRWTPLYGWLLGGMLVISAATCFTLGDNWLALYTYTAVSAGLILPQRFAIYGVGAVTGLIVVTGAVLHSDTTSLIPIALSAFLGGAAMTGLQRLIRTMQELREARQAVAALAASDERLRMARDLHDLLGHSLSLVTLKSELTARFMDQERYAEARAQVEDIEKVSRQALVDVREAIGGYRRPKLAVEIAAARTALTAADIEADTDPAIADPRPGLGPDEEGALGWALREAVTNVVRHSGAQHCTVRLSEYPEPDGSRSLRLEVADDGAGARKGGHRRGNGLTGLAERLALADGRLEAGPGERGRGFTVRAWVPLRAATGPVEEAVPGTVQQ
ncbi:sensor histidine kinase [Streptacidiphilus carbonis]|jgi:two-component system, NarL family, sensor histidine kinase DesK|uniref:sensor histidine kinase n=1 Tax=Streptacidiphilus carbonis TaxID=105422 RepID=UPI0005A91858|nr:histidine kinase [Streptacidiphilus carbonis]